MVYVLVVGMATAMGSATVTEMEMEMQTSGDKYPVKGWEMVVEADSNQGGV
jgi:hypothetical protein